METNGWADDKTKAGARMHLWEGAPEWKQFQDDLARVEDGALAHAAIWSLWPPYPTEGRVKGGVPRGSSHRCHSCLKMVFAFNGAMTESAAILASRCLTIPHAS